MAGSGAGREAESMNMKSIRTYIKQKRRVRQIKTSFKKVSKAQIKHVKARSKRVAVEFRISATQKINGQQFRAWDFVTNRRTALSIAAEKREDGYLARVTPETKGYAIWIRTKA